MLRVIAAAGLLLTIVLLSAEGAMACSCAFVEPKKVLAESTGAVTARLLEVRRLDGGVDIVSSADPTDFVFRTGRVLKGSGRGLARGRRLVVRSVYLGASCGLEVERGGLTGMFLGRQDGRWTSSLCSQVSRAAMLGLSRSRSASRPDPGKCRG